MPIQDPNLISLLSKSQIFQTYDPMSKGVNSAKAIKQRRYRTIGRGINILSYSTFHSLFECPRQFALNKLSSANKVNLNLNWGPNSNIDFAFGTCFESGIQASLLGKSWNETWLDMFLAWDVDLWAVKDRTDDKSFTDAVIAVENFRQVQDYIFKDWEIFYFKDELGNPKPAIELSAVVDLENGYYFVLHMDITLQHKITKELRVLEIKTTGKKNVQNADYENSAQALGYSIVLDDIAGDYEQSATYDVFYLVYNTGLRDFKLFEFRKSRVQRAEWLNTLFLDTQQVHNYRELEFWPKRGNNCVGRFGRVCEYFGTCDLGIHTINNGQFVQVDEEELMSYGFDFNYKISKIIETQKGLI